jgi:hypothetical protein
MFKSCFACPLVFIIGAITTALLDPSQSAGQRVAGPAIARNCVDQSTFPDELVRFKPTPVNPVFTAGGEGNWDVMIRERGWILKTGDLWRMWFTGFDGTRAGLKMLGYATSTDMKVWTNVSDDPMLEPGPDPHDGQYVALNQIIKRDGRYYAYYHGRGRESPFDKWCTNVATSTDLRHWQKYPANPLQPVGQNKSSGIVVHDGKQYRLYTMHDKVEMHLPVAKNDGF